MQNKLRVLIADDEKKICELIIRLIDWDALGFTVIGFANNGLQAYEMALREKPDVIISDIRMPAMSGLELVNKLQNDGALTRFIMISGYREFEYAKSAIKYGVTDYLLKPINAEELNEALARIRVEVDRFYPEKQIELNSIGISQPDSLLRAQIIYALLGNESFAKEISLSQLNNNYHYHFLPGPVGIFIVKIDCSQFDHLSMRPFVIDKINQVLRRTSELYCTDFETICVYSRLYCIYQLKDDPSYFKELVEQLANVIDRYDTYSFTVCLGLEEIALDRLMQSIKVAQRATLYRILGNVNQIVDGKLLPATCSESGALLSHEKSELINTIERNDISGLRRLFASFFSTYLDNQNDQCIPEMMYERYQDIVISIQKTFADTLDPHVNLSDVTNLYESVDNATSIPGFISGLTEAFIQWIKPLIECLEQQTARPIRKAAAYMEENFFKQISLDMAASVAGMSPTYFSAVFKKETGENFSDYLTTLRLNQAKRYLRDTTFSLEKITEMIGFSDYRYFSKLFKKRFAISPGKYRKL